MTHEFAYDLFKDNPILLEENMVIPALRRDKQHVTEYLEGKKINKSLKERMNDFYEVYVDKVVDWEHIENTTWFREHLLKALKDERTVIRRNLPNLSKEKLDSLISEIERNEILTREIILAEISTWPIIKQKILLNFVNLIYHMSGARVVNCESALPQENYIDYSLTDFSERRAILSDTQVFLKIFFELAFETLHKTALPVELLDTLSFEDISYLRKPIERSSFRNKYDELIQSSIQVVKNSEIDFENMVYEIDEPLKMLESISKTFEEIFEQELPEFSKIKSGEKTKEFWKSTTSLGLGILGLVPDVYVSSAVTALGLFQSSNEFIVNLYQLFRNRKEINDYDLSLKNKERVLHQLIEKYSISEKSVLLDTLDLLVDTISTKIKL